MEIKRYLLFIVMLVTLPPYTSNADHITASNIQFECIGEDSFHVKMVIFRNCDWINVPSDETLTWKGLDGSCSGSVTLNRTSVEDVTAVCQGQCTVCESGCSYAYGIQANIYEGIIDLSADTCNEYEFYSLFCCRHRDLDNISGGGSVYHRVEAYLNTGVNGCPSTPEYATDNIPLYYCKDQHAYYSHNVVVPEGDSVVYSLVPPRIGTGSSGQNVNYMPGYSAVEPVDYQGKSPVPNSKDMPFPSGFHINSQTGDIMFVPKSEMMSVLSIRANQYRNGTLVSRTQRDLEFKMISCQGNNSPVITTNNSYSACEFSTINIPVKVADPDSFGSKVDSVFLDWDNPPSINGANFVPDSGLIYASSNLTLTPQQGDAGMHKLVFTARDNVCPVAAQSIRPVSVFIKPKPRATIQKNVNSCGQVDFTANLINVSSADITWNGANGMSGSGKNMTHIYKEPGEYPFTVTLKENDCENTIYDTVVIPPFVRMTLDTGGEVEACEGEPFTILPSTQNETGQVDFHWSTGDSNQNSMTYSFDKDTSVIVTAMDQVGCIDYDTVNVNITKNPVPALMNDPYICSNVPVEIGSGLPDTYHHEWTDIDRNITLGSDTSVIVSNSGIYALTVSDATALACKAYDTIAVKDNPAPEASFTTNFACAQNTTSFMSTSTVSSGNITNYQWNFGDGNTSSSLGPTHFYHSPGTYTVSLKVTTDSSCTDEVIKEIEVHETPEPDFNGVSECVSDSFQFNNLTTYSQGDTIPDYNWTIFMHGIGRLTSEFEPVHMFTDTGLYLINLEATSPNGCSKLISKVIEVHNSPKADFALSDACAKSNLTLQNLSEGNKIVSDWTFMEGTTITEHEPVFSYDHPGIYDVTLKVTDTNGCSDQHSSDVEIFEVPDAGFTYNKTEPSVHFSPNDITFSSYHWDFDDGNSSTDVNPEHTYTENGTYHVRLLVENAHGCTNEEVVSINITNVALSTEEGSTSLDLNIYPNPFTDETVITYSLPEKTEVQIILYDVTGRVVKHLEQGEKDSGVHTNILNTGAAGISAGTYMLKMQAGPERIVRRVVHLE